MNSMSSHLVRCRLVTKGFSANVPLRPAWLRLLDSYPIEAPLVEGGLAAHSEGLPALEGLGVDDADLGRYEAEPEAVCHRKSVLPPAAKNEFGALSDIDENSPDHDRHVLRIRTYWRASG